MKKWNVARLNKENAQAISEYWNIPLLPAIILDVRGYESETLESFFDTEDQLSDPFLIMDMEKAVLRIKKALTAGEKICIYGDYDADGVCSTAMLYSYLCKQNGNVMYYIPEREKDGYGLNECIAEQLNDWNVELLITVDNGIAAKKEIDILNSMGIDTIVTDHHQPPEELPNAIASVDPHRKDCESLYQYFCGAGVVFKLIMALEDENLNIEDLIEEYGDLAALATVGDIVPLTEENRFLTKVGIPFLESGKRAGIKAMLNTAGIWGTKLTAGKISFTLVPRINACGRMGESQKAVKLLLTTDEEEAMEIAKQIEEENTLRQQTEKAIFLQIESTIKNRPELVDDRVIVIDGEGFHEGVVGIIASRIKEKFEKPVIIFSKTQNEEVSKGSGRSVKGFSLCDAVDSCSDMLIKHGGHHMAVGLSIKTDRIDEFRKRINEYARDIGEMPMASLDIDVKLNPHSLNADMIEALHILEPYGVGNPTPLFGFFEMELCEIIPVGGGKHLRLVLRRGKNTIKTILFNRAENEFHFVPKDVVDIAATIDVNYYNNLRDLNIVIKDIRLSGFDTESAAMNQNLYIDLAGGVSISADDAASLVPTREEFAHVYRYLRAEGGWSKPFEMLSARLWNDNINMGKLSVILSTMQELELALIENQEQNTYIKLLPAKEKKDLFSAGIMKTLQKIIKGGEINA